MALNIARRAVPMSPAPAVREPHANQLSVSHRGDMHAHAIITAQMTNTKSEPIANLRIQGIVSSNLSHRTRSGSAARATRVRQPTSANQLIRSLSSPRKSCDPLAGAFQFEIRMRFRFGHHEMNCFLFTFGLSLSECRKLVGANRNDVWIVGADV